MRRANADGGLVSMLSSPGLTGRSIAVPGRFDPRSSCAGMHQPKPTLAERVDIDAARASIYSGSLAGHVYWRINAAGRGPAYRKRPSNGPGTRAHAAQELCDDG